MSLKSGPGTEIAANGAPEGERADRKARVLPSQGGTLLPRAFRRSIPSHARGENETADRAAQKPRRRSRAFAVACGCHGPPVVVMSFMAMNVEAEIRDLKRRVSELEGSFGFLAEQVKVVHKDLLSFQARTEDRFKKVDARFDKIDGRFDKVEGRIEREVRGLRNDLPGIVGSAMREAMRERPGKPRKTP